MAESLYLKGKLSIIPAAEPAALTSLQATENGNYTPPSGYDGFNEVNVNVPAIPAQLTSLSVTSNGDYTPPAGYDGFDEVNVNVPQSAARLTNLSATANGDYTPPAGYDGFNEVNVNVPIPTPELTSLSVTANGQYLPPTGYDGFDEVNVNVSSIPPDCIICENAKCCDSSGAITVTFDQNLTLLEGYLVSIKDIGYQDASINFFQYYRDDSKYFFLNKGATDSISFSYTNSTIRGSFSNYRDRWISIYKVPANFYCNGGASNE